MMKMVAFFFWQPAEEMFGNTALVVFLSLLSTVKCRRSQWSALLVSRNGRRCDKKSAVLIVRSYADQYNETYRNTATINRS
jgi:hypothetical protein